MICNYYTLQYDLCHLFICHIKIKMFHLETQISEIK